jgi:hypothetical protein
MISVKAHYNQGRIVFLEPIPADIVTAELNIVIISQSSFATGDLTVAYMTSEVDRYGFDKYAVIILFKSVRNVCYRLAGCPVFWVIILIGDSTWQIQ